MYLCFQTAIFYTKPHLVEPLGVKGNAGQKS